MNMTASKPKFPPPAHSCFVLVFSILGWGLLESWLVAVHARLLPHAISTLCALCLAWLAARRYRRYRELSRITYGSVQPQGRRFTIGDAGWAILLLAVGSVLGVLVLAGWILPLSTIAIGIMFLPWRHASFHRRHFTMSCVAVLIGAAATIAVGHQKMSPIFLPIASWIFWLCACVALLLTMEKPVRPGRDAAAAALPAAEEPATAE
jgi:hypothetical protein